MRHFCELRALVGGIDGKWIVDLIDVQHFADHMIVTNIFLQSLMYFVSLIGCKC